jgi:histidyl-tRNA synthetase
VGFGFGDAVIVELLRAKNLLPDLTQLRRLDVMVAVTDEDEALYARAVKIASTLRSGSLAVDLVLQPKRMKAVLQLANRTRASHVIVFSPHEAQDGCAIVKSMGDGKQRVVCDAELAQAMGSRDCDWETAATADSEPTNLS